MKLNTLFVINLVVALCSLVLSQNVWDDSEVPTTTKNGNVGIGTSNPRGRLDLGKGGLNNNMRIGDYLDIGETGYRNLVYFGINSILSSSSIFGRHNRFKPNWAPGQGLVMAQGGGGSGSLDFYGVDWNGSSEEKDFPGDFTHVVRFKYDGRVGIGFTDPRGRLDLGKGGLNNNLRIGDYLDIGETGYGNSVYFGINSILSSSSISGRHNRFKPSWARGQGLVMAQGGGGSGNLDIYGINWNGNTSERDFPGDYTHIIRFKYDGKVGIGTKNPTHVLTVNGVVKAEELVLNSVGADFVFEEDYQLPSLDEVETFIKKNKHLPEVPSAKDMQEYGTGVGELQTILLQKIEEITLYVIEMKKLYDFQASKIKLLEEENIALKKCLSLVKKVKQ